MIYGVPETNDPNVTGGAPIPLNVSGSTGIGFNVGEIDKETIENLITSNIQPRPGPDQFQITEVKHGQRIVFVVQVAVGIGEVWQAKDKRYYRRFHYKAEPMEHYEIGMVRNRNIGPHLKLVFGVDERWQKGLRKLGRTYQPTGRLSIHLGIQNASNSVAESALIELGVVPDVTLPPPFRTLGYKKCDATIPTLAVCQCDGIEYPGMRRIPTWQGSLDQFLRLSTLYTWRSLNTISTMARGFGSGGFRRQV